MKTNSLLVGHDNGIDSCGYQTCGCGASNPDVLRGARAAIACTFFNNRFIFVFNQLLNSTFACGRVPKQVGLRVVRRTLIRSDVDTSQLIDNCSSDDC
jgi:hypothetical protein